MEEELMWFLIIVGAIFVLMERELPYLGTSMKSHR